MKRSAIRTTHKSRWNSENDTNSHQPGGLSFMRSSSVFDYFISIMMSDQLPTHDVMIWAYLALTLIWRFSKANSLIAGEPRR
jgi:hypothetical protein